MSALSQRPRVPTKATRLCAEQGFAGDCLQPTLRSGFRQRLKPGVGLLRAALLPSVAQKNSRPGRTAPGHPHGVPWVITAPPARPRPTAGETLGNGRAAPRANRWSQARARVRCAPSPACRAVVVAPGPDNGGRVAGARPCLGPAACPRHRGPGCGVGGWRAVLCRRRGGVSWRTWGASSVAGGRGRRRGPWGVSAAPGTLWEGARCRAVVPGRGAAECVVPWASRRVSRRLARSTGRCTRGWRR